MLRECTSKASRILFSTNVNFNFGKSTIGEPSTNDLNTTDWDKPTEAEISTKFDGTVNGYVLEKDSVLSLEQWNGGVNTTEEEKSTRPVSTKSNVKFENKSTKSESTNHVASLEVETSVVENNLLILKPDGKNACLAMSEDGAVPKRKPDVRFSKYEEVFEKFEGVGGGGDECVGVGATRVSNSVDFVSNNVLRSISRARLVTENLRWPATSSAGRRTRPGAGRTTSPWRGAGTQSRTIRRGTVTPGSRGSKLMLVKIILYALENLFSKSVSRSESTNLSSQITPK